MNTTGDANYFDREARAILAGLPDLGALADELAPWTNPYGEVVPPPGDTRESPLDGLRPSREVRRHGDRLFGAFLERHAEPA